MVAECGVRVVGEELRPLSALTADGNRYKWRRGTAHPIIDKDGQADRLASHSRSY